MTPAQQAALEALAGRALDTGELAPLDPLVAARNDVAIASALSAGRVRIAERRVSELGVRRALGVVDASRLLGILKASAAAADAGTVEPWLAAVLTGLGVQAGDHPAYQETVGSAWRWLTQPDGLDVGSAAARDMLDLIAAGNGAAAPACVAIKALAEQPDPIHVGAVSDALNVAEGRMTL